MQGSHLPSRVIRVSSRVIRTSPRAVLAASSRLCTPASVLTSFGDKLDSLGVLGPMVAEGEVVRRIQFRTPAGPFAEFALADLADRTAFPFRLHLEQARLTPLLLAALEALPNARIVFDAGFETLTQDEDGITVTADRGDGKLTVAADYLLGTDGARSARAIPMRASSCPRPRRRLLSAAMSRA